MCFDGPVVAHLAGLLSLVMPHAFKKLSTRYLEHAPAYGDLDPKPNDTDQLFEQEVSWHKVQGARRKCAVAFAQDTRKTARLIANALVEEPLRYLTSTVLACSREHEVETCKLPLAYDLSRSAAST